MDIPKILTCRGISLPLNCTFRFSKFKILSIKLFPVASHYFHLLSPTDDCNDFGYCHCKNTHIDMDIPKILPCRGISLPSCCIFRISEFKHFVDKTTSGSKPLFSSFERFFHPVTISTILVIFKLSL